jgi:hypothetical protein
MSAHTVQMGSTPVSYDAIVGMVQTAAEGKFEA